MELPATTKRVAIHTDEQKNSRIMTDMEHRLWYYLDHPEEIDKRLQELDNEWDIERTLEMNASFLALAGLLLTRAVSRKFFIVPAVVTGFLLQHALQGWCPPVPILRSFGVRTQSEIELERYTLKAMRGDYGELAKQAEVPEAKKEFPRQALQAMTH